MESFYSLLSDALPTELTGLDLSIALNFPRNNYTQSKYVFKKRPINGIFLLPSRCPTVQRCVSCEISQFCQISELRLDSYIMFV